jgi:purine-cytosine permease-like protein
VSAKLFGRISVGALLVGIVSVALLAALPPHFMHLGPVHVVDWAGLLIYVGAPATWASAIYHWARYFPAEGPRRRWGIVVVLGLVPGGIAYWLRGVRYSDQ